MTPSFEEMDRARRQKHTDTLQDVFDRTTVAICGLGGLGSNIATMLAKAGIGKLILMDFDRVEVTNLQRQMYKAGQVGMYKADALAINLKEQNPYITLEAHVVKLSEENTLELIQDADIVCEAFDGAEQKAWLTDLVLTRCPDKYYVSSSGMAGVGLSNDIRTKKITNRFYLCGDMVSDVENNDVLVATRVMLCAAHEANAVLEILSKK